MALERVEKEQTKSFMASLEAYDEIINKPSEEKKISMRPVYFCYMMNPILWPNLFSKNIP